MAYTHKEHNMDSPTAETFANLTAEAYAVWLEAHTFKEQLRRRIFSIDLEIDKLRQIRRTIADDLEQAKADDSRLFAAYQQTRTQEIAS